ncbi:MAG: ABC transporter ATP-binding protein [Parasutterella excrementihominis]|jgi:O-antigen export system, ATP-binding protein|uniref:ABC transporter ATP-binding protein n=1 Tax=Parasutterella excrementihominis TaxID=487175 RepID=UPI00399C1989
MGMATGGRIGLTESGRTVVRSLDHLNLEIKSHERVGLIGHNGAGKSTLLRVLSSVYEPTEGVAKITGSIGSLIDISLGIDLEATGLENIYLRSALLGIPKKNVDKELNSLVEFTELGDFINMPVRTYSTGMHMRLAFAVSTMISPDILLMDEWLSVGDQSFQEKAENRLNRLIERTNILVIATHSRRLIERCCTRVLWLEHGRLKMDGSPEQVCPLYFGL